MGEPFTKTESNPNKKQVISASIPEKPVNLDFEE